MFSKIVLVLSLGLVAGEAHAAWDTLDLRKSLEKSVFMVSPSKEIETIGTAFTVEAPSGKTYTLTNRHVCHGSTDGYLYFIQDRKIVARRRILQRYAAHDLCLAEGIKGSPALKLADQVFIEHVGTAGFPLAQPFTASLGDIVGTDMMQVVTEDDIDECKTMPNHRIVMAPAKESEGGAPDIKQLCVFGGPAYATNMVIGPGASGSPVINQDHELVGVVFAYSTEVPWAKVVPLDFVKDFLKDR